MLKHSHQVANSSGSRGERKGGAGGAWPKVKEGLRAEGPSGKGIMRKRLEEAGERARKEGAGDGKGKKG